MEEIDLRQLLKVILDKKILIILTTLVFLILGIVYSKYLKKPIYESSTTLVLSKQANQAVPNQEITTEEAITQNDILLNQKLVDTYSEIIKSKKVLKQVIANLSITTDEIKLAKNISVVSVKNTEIIKVTVKDFNAETAERIANEIPNVFATEVLNIYNIQNVYTIDKAEIASEASNINTIKDTGLVGMVGFILSIMLVLLLYYFDNTIKGIEDVENYLELNVLTCIPENKVNNKVKERESSKRQRKLMSKTAV